MGFRHFNSRLLLHKVSAKSKEGAIFNGRRKLIQLMGLGIFAANPIVDLIRQFSAKPFFIKATDKRVTVLLDNQRYWSTDIRKFDGHPKLLYHAKEGSYLIGLKDAFFPGTRIPADFSAKINKQGSVWMVAFHFPKLHLESTVPLLYWLSGNAMNMGAWKNRETRFAQDNLISATINQGGQTFFTPDWVLRIEGARTVEWQINQTRGQNDVAMIKPFSRPLRVYENISRETLLEMPSCKACQPLLDQLVIPDTSILEMLPETTAKLCIASGQDRQKNATALAWLENESDPLMFSPGGRQPHGFQYSSFIMALEPLPDNDLEILLMASATREAFWYSHPTGSFRFSSDAKPQTLKIAGNQRSGYALDCESEVESAVFHIDGAYSLPVSYPDKPPTLKITTQEPVKGKRQVNQINLINQQIIFKPKQAIRLRFLRPEDLLMLDFEFHNFRYTSKGQQSYLEIADTGKPGLMIIRFQTQHTLEEAFYETNSLPRDDSSQNLTTQSVTLPAKYLRAGKSRLVYEVPPDMEGIPLIFSELLNWKRFKLRVHPRAFIPLPSKKAAIETMPGALKRVEQRTVALAGSHKSYTTKLFASGKNKNQAQLLTTENGLAKILKEEQMMTLRPSFDIRQLVPLALKPEPIPPDQTAIEAPALLYLSPNQLCDFDHRIELSLKVREGASESTNQFKSRLRILNPLASTSGQVTELWHTVMGVKLGDNSITRHGLAALNSIRALWAHNLNSDYTQVPPAFEEKPFRASLNPSDRHLIVHESSNYSINAFKPKSVKANLLVLSSLGAHFDLHGLFYNQDENTQPYLNLLEWQHKAMLGRDNFVKVVRAGFLYPFGHKAALIKITERKFDQATRAAVNRQRMYVVVTEPQKFYQRNDPQEQFIPFPFIAVQINTLSTPNIDLPENIKGGTIQRLGQGQAGKMQFVIKTNGQPFLFHLTLTDKEGGEQRVKAPLIFIDPTTAYQGNPQEVHNHYTSAQNQLNNIGFKNQSVSFAESLVPGDTTYATSTIWFAAQQYPATGSTEIKFHPVLKQAEAYIKSVVEITGSKQPTRFSLTDDDNPGQIFAMMDADHTIPLDFSGGSDKSGGFLCPNIEIKSISKLLGPTSGDTAKIKNLDFAPSEFFAPPANALSAKLFGAIDLFKLLKVENHTTILGNLVNQLYAQKLKVEALRDEIAYWQNELMQGNPDAGAMLDQKNSELAGAFATMKNLLNSTESRIPNLKSYADSEGIVTSYHWNPEFSAQSTELFGGILIFKVDDTKKVLTVTTSMERPFDTTQPTVLKGEARLDSFGILISLPFGDNPTPIIGVKFDYIRFVTDSEHGNDVKIAINAMEPFKFLGPLSFINNLQDLIPLDGFAGDNLSIKRSGSGLSIGYQLPIPSVEVGVCNISNLLLGATLNLPLNGDKLSMAFNFCTRENPFLLTVSCFGGGGFFLLDTYIDGLRCIEGAFEFGGAFSLNVGVASGGVKIMGGFYFAILFDDDGSEVTLAGYLRINGHLSIIGLINLSMEFYLELKAILENGKVSRMEGSATLKVKVEVLFFSKTVSVTVRRQLNAADADPSFQEVYQLEEWQSYCLAFA